MRQALWLTFSCLLVLITATLLFTSYRGTRQLARHQAGALLAEVQLETEIRPALDLRSNPQQGD